MGTQLFTGINNDLKGLDLFIIKDGGLLLLLPVFKAHKKGTFRIVKKFSTIPKYITLQLLRQNHKNIHYIQPHQQRPFPALQSKTCSHQRESQNA